MMVGLKIAGEAADYILRPRVYFVLLFDCYERLFCIDEIMYMPSELSVFIYRAA